ncbi:MAG: hypothetical protein HUJ25_01240 [Crocinitomicaceae bacterium]|nr:hypothetical protein [Crocinitomicaceae bacterium]
MPKYRILTSDELKELEDDFVKYLVVNGITADEWEQIKLDDADKAGKIIDLFSDVVFEKILRQAMFLDKVDPGVIQSIQCLKDKMILVAAKRKDVNTDLTKVDLKELTTEEVELVKGEKEYSKTREMEMFKLIESGYEISDGSLFKGLILATV